MNTEYIIFCEQSVVSMDGVPSFTRAFDTIRVKDLPSGAKDLKIVYLVTGEGVIPGAKVMFKFNDPSGNQVFENGVVVPDEVSNNRYRHFLTVPILPLLQEGKYEAKVEVEGTEIGSAHIFVKKD